MLSLSARNGTPYLNLLQYLEFFMYCTNLHMRVYSFILFIYLFIYLVWILKYSICLAIYAETDI